MLVALEDLKRQCNVDFEEDDRLLVKYAIAAERFIEQRIYKSLEEFIADNDGDLPGDLEIAILMLVAHWYRVREAVSTTSQARVPYGVDALIKPYTIPITE